MYKDDLLKKKYSNYIIDLHTEETINMEYIAANNSTIINQCDNKEFILTHSSPFVDLSDKSITGGRYDVKTQGEKHWVSLQANVLSNYKFVIVCENDYDHLYGNACVIMIMILFMKLIIIMIIIFCLNRFMSLYIILFMIFYKLYVSTVVKLLKIILKQNI